MAEISKASMPAPNERSVTESTSTSDWVLGETTAIRKIARHVERAAEVECTVLISGETGTGKEIFARLLHRAGPRFGRPFVPVNCRP